jgi:hypothetical protein
MVATRKSGGEKNACQSAYERGGTSSTPMNTTIV